MTKLRSVLDNGCDVTAATLGGGRDRSEGPQPGSAALGGAGAEALVETRVEALDGCERKLLLGHLARVHPDAVDSGFAWLTRYHAAAAERQRAARRRREHDKRRRREEERERG